MVKAFLVAFSICFLLGVLEGCEERRKTEREDPLIETAVGHMQMHSYGLPKSHTEIYNLEYICHGTTYFTYDLSNGEQQENKHPEGGDSFLPVAALERIFEGATGWKLVELSRAGLPAETVEVYKNRNMIAIVVGAISGYSVGHYLASKQRVPCDNATLVDKLKGNSTFAVEVRREFFKQRIEGLLLQVDSKSFSVVDLQDKFLEPEEYALPQDNLKATLYEMALMRKYLSITNSTPTAQVFRIAYWGPREAARALLDQPNFFASRFPGSHRFLVSYDGPYDPTDPLKSLTRRSVFSRNFMLMILFLSVASVILFLILAVVVARTKKKKSTPMKDSAGPQKLSDVAG